MVKKNKLFHLALLSLLALNTPSIAADTAVSPPLDVHRIAGSRYGSDAPWYERNVPFFESSDPLIDRIYYYRWQLFRAHQRDLGADGYITTEFLDDVRWQVWPYASLNDATSFHILEGRWLRDRRYAGDYIGYMHKGGNNRHFSEAIADATYQRFLVDGDLSDVVQYLPAMKQNFAAWSDHYSADKKLYWIMPLYDATEGTVASIDASGGTDGFRGGEAFRPSINSYMFANARAISRLAALSGNEADAKAFAKAAQDLGNETVNSLWNPDSNHFMDRYKADNDSVKYWQFIRARELVGYLPWTYHLVPDDPRFASAWKHVMSPDELLAPAGLRTVEPSYQYYMHKFKYSCQWNGPIWPFQTSQALMGMINLLQDYHQVVVNRSDFTQLLHRYAALHLKDGVPDLQENYNPDTGKVIVGLPRSHHYFHSSFNDLVISGLVGIRPQERDILVVDPLAPTNPSAAGYLKYFALQDVPYHGHLVTVVFDAEGRQYRLGAGLFVFVDGHLAASAPNLGRLTVQLAHKAPLPTTRPIDLAMNLRLQDFPRGNASINADVPSLHQALDGRIWFFPEMTNGWSTVGGTGPQWFSVDFGKELLLSSAELALYADDANFAAPDTYRVQAMIDGRWVDVGASGRPVPNGITNASWKPLKSRQLRVVFTIPTGKAMRLVELKVF